MNFWSRSNANERTSISSLTAETDFPDSQATATSYIETTGSANELPQILGITIKDSNKLTYQEKKAIFEQIKSQKTQNSDIFKQKFFSKSYWSSRSSFKLDRLWTKKVSASMVNSFLVNNNTNSQNKPTESEPPTTPQNFTTTQKQKQRSNIIIRGAKGIGNLLGLRTPKNISLENTTQATSDKSPTQQPKVQTNGPNPAHFNAEIFGNAISGQAAAEKQKGAIATAQKKERRERFLNRTTAF